MTGKQRDEFSTGVRSVLAHRAGFRYSRPSCRALTVGPSNEGPDAKSNVGVAAHITAASVGGPRFDKSLTCEQRRSVANGIWLCYTHSKEIDDDDSRFSVEVLRAWKQHSEDDAMALLGRPISSQSLEISTQVALHRAPDNSLLVTGTTNLPNETKLWVQLQDSKIRRLLGNVKTKVGEGMFAGTGFTNNDAAHAHGWYTVEVLAYFNGPWRQSQAVLDIVGRLGEKLVGSFVESVHPEFSESERRFRASFQCIAPPLVGAPARSDNNLVQAIEMTKNAVLEVEGQLSANKIEKIVALFMTSPGLRRNAGWTASPQANGSIVVGYSFWSGSLEAIAEWVVILERSEVRYRNLDAKYMSWAPED